MAPLVCRHRWGRPAFNFTRATLCAPLRWLERLYSLRLAKVITAPSQDSGGGAQASLASRQLHKPTNSPVTAATTPRWPPVSACDVSALPHPDDAAKASLAILESSRLSLQTTVCPRTATVHRCATPSPRGWLRTAPTWASCRMSSATPHRSPRAATPTSWAPKRQRAWGPS
jgi:hypothetical protein